MGANCCCGVRQKEAFSVSHQLSWQPFKSFECRRRRRLHAVQNKQEERDAGSLKSEGGWRVSTQNRVQDCLLILAHIATWFGCIYGFLPRLKRNTIWISWQIFCEKLLYCEPCLNENNEIGASVLQLSHFEMRRVRLECQRSDCSFTQLPTRCILRRTSTTSLCDIWGCIEQP